MTNGVDMIVFSHLRWNFVYQRPQHILSRLSRRMRVFFIEEPICDGEHQSYLKISEPTENVIVVQPHTPLTSGGFADDQLEEIRRLLPDLLEAQGITKHLAWFYTPMALPLIDDLDPELVIFDSMDALDAFLNAPPKLHERESELLTQADIVFTGGRSLYGRLKSRHQNVHCFPSSVDAAHFARRSAIDPEDQRGIEHPRLGYFGVIDERLDMGLLATVAANRPDWQIVLVGPVAKIREEDLPRANNLHYLGQKPYSQLPDYLSGWDVCLMPFARNQATRYISPTKVLEYMAAELPIVSTPITDVAEAYGDIVYLADNAEEFTQACDKALSASAEERAQRVGGMRQVLSQTSWDRTVEQMLNLIEAMMKQSGNDSGSDAAMPQSEVRDSRSFEAPVLVVGGGPTGLSAAYHLGEQGYLLEQNESVGGWCRSMQVDGFTFDFAGHIMFSNDPYVHELYATLLGDNVHWQDREAWIYSKDVYTRYPFQGALYGLPPQVIKECIVGAIEARYGSLKAAKNSCAAASSAAPNGNGKPKSHSNGNGNGNGNGNVASRANSTLAIPHGDVKDCCGDGILESSTRLVPTSANGSTTGEPTEPANFEEFIYKVWGAGIAKHFAIPYNRKLWAVPLSEMETSWLGGRVPMPDLEEMIEGALQPVGKPMGPNARFGYPLRGGFQALMNGFLPYIKDRMQLNAKVVAVSPLGHRLQLSDGTWFSYEHLISTMPLPVLVRLMGDEAPKPIRDAVGRLRHVSVRCVNLGIGREKLTEKHWIYYPEQTVFHRVFVQGNASPYCNPPGGFGLTCEITYSPQKPLPCDGQDLIDRCVSDCQQVGLIRPDDPVWVANQVDMPYAYVVYDHARRDCVKLIRQWLADQDITLAGRYSEWEYYNSDHAFIAGKKAAEQAQESFRSRGPGHRALRSVPASIQS